MRRKKRKQQKPKRKRKTLPPVERLRVAPGRYVLMPIGDYEPAFASCSSIRFFIDMGTSSPMLQGV